MDLINIAFVSSREYLQHLSVALVSLFTHSPAGGLNVYILNVDFDQTAWDLINRLNRKHGHRLNNVRISDHCLDGVAASGEYTRTTYRKLFIPDVIPHDKVLYLDSDLVVVNPLGELYAVDVEDVYLAAVVNPGFSRHRQLGMDPGSRYFNAGVMLMNLKKWREDSIRAKVLQFAQNHPESVLADQDGLNAVMNGRWKELSPKYNLQTYYFENAGNGASLPSAVREAVASPTIIHFTACPKAWYFKSTDKYKYLYWKYLRLTPFRRYIPPDLTLANLTKRLLPTSIKPYLAGWMKRFPG